MHAAMTRALGFGVLAALPLLAAPSPAIAVTILDSTWRQEGGARGREWAGFRAHLQLAAEPQFRPVLALGSDGVTWGEASGTWIGNDDRYAYILTAAHIYELPAQRDAYAVRGADGRVHHPDKMWVHPKWNGDTETRTGYDLVILRLRAPLSGLGPPPVLYGGNGEAGRVITFVGFGSRGIGSKGEKDTYYRGSDKAAAEGMVDEWVAPVVPLPKGDDGGNYLGIFLPKEDGSMKNPYGGARKPVTAMVGLLGSGDSGGSAWMKGDNGEWVIVGVNSNGSGTASYGDSSWFARVSPHRGWIENIFPGVRFSQ